MKKTLILLFVVLMTATLFVACSSSPKANYVVKVVLENVEDDGKSLGIDGTYYMNDKTVTTKSEPGTDVAYVLYSDPSCEKETGLFLFLNQEFGKQEYFVNITDNDEIGWYSITKAVEAGATIAELSVKASDTPFIDLDGLDEDNGCSGSIKMYAGKNITLTINENNPE